MACDSVTCVAFFVHANSSGISAGIPELLISMLLACKAADDYFPVIPRVPGIPCRKDHGRGTYSDVTRPKGLVPYVDG